MCLQVHQSVIAVIFLGVLEKAWLGMWGHAMAEACGRQESGRHEGGHVYVIMALTHFAPAMLHTRDSLEATQGTREGEENALNRGNDKFHCFVLRERELICSPLAYVYGQRNHDSIHTHIFKQNLCIFCSNNHPEVHIFSMRT